MGSKVASSHRTASRNHLRGGGFTFVSSGRRVFPLFSILSSILSILFIFHCELWYYEWYFEVGPFPVQPTSVLTKASLWYEIWVL